MTRPLEPAGDELERRVGLAVIAAAAAIFGLLLILVPSFFLSFDEAKYIGIGYSLLDGLGPQTPFGGYFLVHAPIWSATLVLPQAWFGIDPLATGHLLDALGGIGLVIAAGALGWRVRPAVGGLAAAGTIAITYVHDLTRTARLDVPVGFLILVYLLVGFNAVRNGRVSWAIASGLLFAFAFEVKEIALPFAIVPVAAGIVWGRPWRDLARTAGWLVLAASVGLSWWVILVAQLVGIVYRLGTPAWTLVPIATLVLGGAILAIAGAARADRPALQTLGRRLRLIAPDGDPGSTGETPRGRIVLAAIVVGAWCVGLLVIFARELGVRATQLVDVRQIGLYAATWLPGVLKLAAVAGAAGVLLSIPAWRAASGRRRAALGDLWLATLCGAPLVLLVIEVGEPPRNYVAQLAILAALAGAGWLWLVEAAVGRWSRGRTLDPAGEGHASPRPWLGVVPLVLLVATLGSGALLGAHALTTRETRSGRALASAVTTTVDWVRANVPAGTPVAIGSMLSYEISLGLRGHNPTAQVRHLIAVADPATPEGIRLVGDPKADDWIAIDVVARNANEYQAFNAHRLVRDLRASGATYWIYVTQASTSAPSIVPVLATAPGIREVAHWTFPTSTEPIGVHVYAIDPAALAFPVNRIVVSPEALDRLVGMLERAGAVGRPAACRIAASVDVEPPSAASSALVARLRAPGCG